MQNHFIVTTISSSSLSNSFHSINEQSPPYKNDRDAVFIDLSSFDSTISSQDQSQLNEQSFNSKQATNDEEASSPSEICIEKSKIIAKKKNSKMKIPSLKKVKKQINNANQLIVIDSLQEQPIYLNEMMNNFEANNTVPQSRPQKMVRQIFISEHSHMLITKKLEETYQKQSESIFCKDLMNQKQQLESFFPFDALCCEDEPAFMKFWLPNQGEDSRINKGYRLTRNQSKKHPSIQPFYIQFQDQQVKTRFNVAKYRFGITECRKTIDQLVVKTSNKLHFGQKDAIVYPYPNIEPNSYKHRILVECLRIQLRKRRFIYLD